MTKSLRIVLEATVAFALALALMWVITSRLAEDKTIDVLEGSPAAFRDVNENALDGVLWYAGRLVMDDIAKTVRPYPVDVMRSLAERHHLDEVNIVASNGLVVASDHPRHVGLNLRGRPGMQTAFDMLDDRLQYHAGKQPFRPGIGNPETVSKYFILQYLDGSGFLEVGITLDHFNRIIRRVDDYDFKTWRIGQYGYFESPDRDGDGDTDPAPSDDYVGEIEEIRLENGEGAYAMEFGCFGLLYRAVIPYREFYEQRSKTIGWLALIAGAFFAAIVGFLVKAVRASDRERAISEKLRGVYDKIAERNTRDLASARSIQLSALPCAETFRIDKLDSTVAAVTYPAREVGGDLYGMFELADGRIAFAVGDVSGKGVPAAMFMHVAKDTYELRVRSHDDLAEAVALANDHLCERNAAEMFVTGWFGLLDPVTGIVEYVNAGHNFPYVLRADGFVERIVGKGGRFLGVFPKAKFTVHRFKLNRGDRLFLYTDGVTEAMNADRKTYGQARLMKTLGGRPRDLCGAVKADIDSFVAGTEQSDDLTMVVVAYHGRPERIQQTFSADKSELASMLEFVRGTVRFGYRRQQLRLLNAVDEVLANIANYSSSRTVDILVENVPGRCRVTVADFGDTYNPLTHRDPDTKLKIQDRPIGGLGILMAKKLVSSVRYSREGGRNVLSLVQLDFDGTYRQIV